ncbi:hypothetical protein Q73_03635 [Bacillus coahuilensis m2-6]|nr:FixH family protein [Bacillus coahuilensis]KUP09175.1 hypothetical protein Q73_03635 [Bacillus coahuilensis m2-6]
MKKVVLGFAMSALLLAACGEDTSNGDKHENMDMEPVAIAADLSVPEKAEVGEAVTIDTHVTQGDASIEDADEVKYEIWMDGMKDSSEMLEAAVGEDGHYTLEKTFDQDGVYYVQVHVTAEGMHTMPKSPIAVGDAEVTTEDMDSSEMDHSKSDDHSNHSE